MKIVVVEDSPHVRQAILLRLRDEPFLTVSGQAERVEEAIATISLCSPDVVLLDILLTDGSGLDVLMRLRQQGFSGLIFMLSANPHETHAFHCNARGANGYYDKSSDMERLVEDLREISLGQHTHHYRIRPENTAVEV